MDYNKKIRNNIIMAVIYAVLGIAIMLSAVIFDDRVNTGYLSSLGSCFTVIGIVMFIKFIRIKRNPELMRKFQVSANDERNIMIADKARVYAFGAYSVGAATAIIVCSIFYMQREALIVTYNLCALVLLYVLFSVILHKKY